MQKYVSPYDFEKVAKQKLTDNAYQYYRSGANDEITLQDNLDAFKRIKIKPRVMQNVQNFSMETTVLGHKVSMPLGIAPTAMHKLAHKDGEIATAQAAKMKNIIYTLSSLSTSSLREVKTNCPDSIIWFQLYVTKNRIQSEKNIQKAEKLGYSAIVFTVDMPIVGKREQDERNGFFLPSEFSLKILSEVDDSKQIEKQMEKKQDQNNSNLLKLFNESMDNNTWEDIKWLKSITKLPIIVKGIMCAEDAELAVKHGCDAIWISNHGARQIDSTLATIDVLESVVQAVKSTGIEIYIDGGIRRGSDIFKALALGANHVFIGRLCLWALASEGKEGILTLLDILQDELKRTMILSGCNNINSINKNYIIQTNFNRNNHFSKL